eukprot:532686_1
MSFTMENAFDDDEQHDKENDEQQDKDENDDATKQKQTKHALSAFKAKEKGDQSDSSQESVDMDSVIKLNQAINQVKDCLRVRAYVKQWTKENSSNFYNTAYNCLIQLINLEKKKQQEGTHSYPWEGGDAKD